MISAAPQHKEILNIDSIILLWHIEIKAIQRIPRLLSSLDSVGRLLLGRKLCWNTFAATPVYGEMSFYDFPLFILSIMSISSPVVGFRSSRVTLPLFCVTEFCSIVSLWCLAVIAFVSPSGYVCVCVLICFVLFLALGKWISRNDCFMLQYYNIVWCFYVHVCFYSSCLIYILFLVFRLFYIFIYFVANSGIYLFMFISYTFYCF